MSELIPGTSKSFQGLEVDYAFFEQSIDECEQALRQWRPLLQNRFFMMLLSFYKKRLLGSILYSK